MLALKIPRVPRLPARRLSEPVERRTETAGQEGRGKVVIRLDDHGRVRQVHLQSLALRGFEGFLEGRPYTEVPDAIQRLCGICPVSHHLAAVKAMDRIAGYGRLTQTAEKLRRLMHCGQFVQSHAVHLYHLTEPDLLLGYEGESNRRGLLEVARDFPQLATEGVLMRRFGQEVVRAVAGRRMPGAGAGAGAVPGGMRQPLLRENRDILRADVDQVIDWAVGALRVLERLHDTNPAFYDHFGEVGGNMIGLVGRGGAVDFYSGRLRARDGAGATLFDGIAPAAFRGVLAEAPGLDGPHIRALGPEIGWYRVGPLARLQVCDLLTSEKAETERQRLLAVGGGKPLHGTLFQHGARLVELLHAAELIRDLLDDPDLLGHDLMADRGAPQREAVGVLESPRGTLFHRFEVDDEDRVHRCELIISTASNTRAMTEAVAKVAVHHCDGRAITEGLLGHIEVAIRAFDPCLACATHALGQMPLSVELIDAAGAVVSGLRRSADGGVTCCVPS